MNRREAVKRIVRYEGGHPMTLREVSELLAIRCESWPHEFKRGRCAWCGKPEGEE